MYFTCVASRYCKFSIIYFEDELVFTQFKLLYIFTNKLSQLKHYSIKVVNNRKELIEANTKLLYTLARTACFSISGLKEAIMRILVLGEFSSAGVGASLTRPTCLWTIRGELDCRISLINSSPSAFVIIVEGIEVPKFVL